ncbi:MAG: ParB N-terminal domain-containing protein [Phycisphaerae bacterium]|jgi:ParB family chromosome partitioning protein
MMDTAPILLIKDRRREMIPIDKIKVINSRTRDEEQFTLNVQSIEANGQLKDIRVNDKFLARSGFYELICGEGRLIAQKRLGQAHIRAEVVTCTRKQAYLESLVENLARSRPGTMEFARELKNLHDEGWTYEQIATVACRTSEYVRHYIDLVEKGEERLIQGVEQGVFPISFAVLVASTEDGAIQNVLMDAFDRKIVNCENFAKARAIIRARMDPRNRKEKHNGPANYTVNTLKSDIAQATQAKESYVREAQDKETRLFALLDGLNELWSDTILSELLQVEGLSDRPELAGTYDGVTSK